MPAHPTTDSNSHPVSAVKTPRRRSLVGRMVLALGSALFFLLMVLIAAYFALRAPWVYEKLKPELVARLQPLGIELQDPGSLQLDLLRSVTLKNAKIRWHDKTLGNADLTIGSFDIAYSLTPLLKGRLEIRKLLLRDVNVLARLHTATETPATPAAEPMSLAQLDELLRSPPLDVAIRELRLENIQFDVQMEDDQQQWQHLRGHVKQLLGHADWQSDLLQGQLRLALDHPWLLAQGNNSDAQELHLEPVTHTNLNWDLVLQDDHWLVRQATLDNALALQTITASTTHQQVKTALGKIDSLAINTTADVKTRQGNTHRQGLAGIFPLTVDTHLESTTQGLAVDNFQQDSLTLDVLADHHLTMELQGVIDPFNASGPPLALTSEQHLTLGKLEADSPGQRSSIQNLGLNLVLAGNVPWREKPAFPLGFSVALDGQADSLQFTQAAPDDQGAAVKAFFAPSLKLAANGKLYSFDDPLQSIMLHFEPQLTTRKLSVELGQGKQATHYRVARETFSTKGDLDHGQLSLSADLGLQDARVPQLLRKFSSENHLDLTTDLAFTQPTVGLQIALDKKPLAEIDIKAHNLPDTLSLHPVIKANLTSHLKKLHTAAQALDMTGNVKIDWRGDLSLQHGAQSLLDADFTHFDRWPFEHKGTLQIRQTRAPRDPAGIRLAAPVRASYGISTQNGIRYKTQLHLKAPAVQMPPLVKPVPLQVWDQTEFDWPLRQIKSNGTLRIAGTDAASFRLSADNRPRKLSFDSRWTLHPRAKWKRYLPALAALESVGGLTTAHWLKGQLSHPEQSILDVTGQQIKQLRAKLTLDTHITQASDQPGSTLQLSAPIDLNQTLHWSGKDAQLSGEFDIASAQTSEQLALQSLTGSFRVGANSGLHPDGGQFSLHISDGSLILNTKSADKTTVTNLKEVLAPLDLTIAARQEREKVILESLRLQTGGDFLDLQASGEATLDGKNAQITSTLTTRLRADLLVNPYLSGTGSATIPWRLVLLDGNQISIDGSIRFNDLDVATKALQLQGLDGSLKIEEELLWTGKQLKFRYLEDPDPFQRVDFTRIQPFLDDKESLRVLRITAADKTLGPALASLQFKQNVLHLQQLDLDLFGGHLTGQVYLDTRPGNWKIGLLSRITQVDPRQLLARDSAARQGAYSPVSARTALEFDIRQRLLQGRIDISKISRDQLYQLLEVIDPEYKDEQIAQLRSALRIAYPQKLSVEMHQGLLNLEVKVSALPAPLRIRGLPLTPLIQHFAGVALETLGKVPLE